MELADNPIFRLRVNLLAAKVSWDQSAEMTRREMLAVIRVWNELHEDVMPTPTPTR